MDTTRERFGLDDEEFEKCLRAAEELRGFSADGTGPTVEELARDWARAKAAQRRAALSLPSLLRALTTNTAPFVRRLVPHQVDRRDGHPGRA